MNSYKNILLINVSGIGDFVESAGALRSVRIHNPGANITLLVSSRVFEYAKGCPYADRVYSFPVAHGKGFSLSSLKDIREILRIIKILRSIRFDVAVNFYSIWSWGGALRMFLLFKLIAARRTIGRKAQGRGFFFTKAIDDFLEENKNQTYYYNLLASEINNSKEAGLPSLWRNSTEKNEADALLRQWGIKPGDFLLIVNPGYDRPTRAWESKRFAEVCDYFGSDHRAKIVIVGSSGEQHIALDIKSKMKNPCFVAAGKTKVGGLIELISRSNLLISTNSAAIHIAGIEGVPLVCVSGSSDPWLSRLSGNDHKIELLWKKIECNPCYYIQCPKKYFMNCMDIITAAEVITSAKKVMKNSTAE